MYFAFPCSEFGVVIAGLGNSGAGGVTGEQTGSGSGLILGGVSGLMINFLFIFALRCKEKIQLGAGTEAFGVNYLAFFSGVYGFFKVDVGSERIQLGLYLMLRKRSN